MPKIAKELSALEVKRMSRPGLHAVGGVTGLSLHVSHAGAKSWIVRATVGGKRRDIGLGPIGKVTLAAARDKARETHAKIAAGIDPIAEKKSLRLDLIRKQNSGRNFREAADEYYRSKKQAELSQKYGKQWQATLIRYAYPAMGDISVQDLNVGDILRVLEPIWATKNETAVKLRGRIEEVLAWATVSGMRAGENPALWKGNLQALLSAPGKVYKSKGHPAIAVDEVASWFHVLNCRSGLAAMALQFLTLTAARSGEIRGASWTEIDHQKGIWTIPGDRMKAEKEHRVPLSDAAVFLLEQVPRMQGSNLIFPAPRGGPFSDMSISAVMRRMHETSVKEGKERWLDPRSGAPAVPHGLRSTFRDWVAERTNYPGEMAELALAHKVGTAVERAYLRGDMMEKRRAMMEDWANFVQPHAAVKI